MAAVCWLCWCYARERGGVAHPLQATMVPHMTLVSRVWARAQVQRNILRVCEKRNLFTLECECLLYQVRDA